jgi:hypothetical protein
LFLVALPITVLLTVMYGVFNFVFCAGIVFILARDFLLLEWERNHKCGCTKRGQGFTPSLNPIPTIISTTTVAAETKLTRYFMSFANRQR